MDTLARLRSGRRRDGSGGRGTQLREEDDIANAFRSRQKNAESVDTDAHASRRRHAVFEREQKIIIDLLLLLTGLRFKHPSLLDGVVLLTVCRRDLHPTNRQLEYIEDTRLLGV